MKYLAWATGAVFLAVLVWAVITGCLLLLPPSCAVAVMFIGLVLFLVGARLHSNVPTAMGGMLMFAGVFAAALLGALG